MIMIIMSLDKTKGEQKGESPTASFTCEICGTTDEGDPFKSDDFEVCEHCINGD